MIYRFLTRLAGGVISCAGPLLGSDARQRLGRGPQPAMTGGVWLHGASVGEITSARVLIEGLADLPLIVTSNTVTGRETARSLGVPAVLAPLDTPQAVARFLDLHQPRVAVTIENELWPNRAEVLARRGIAPVIVGARLSSRSAARWGKVSRLASTILGGVRALSAQDAASEARLLALGLPLQALLPQVNLKRLGPAAAVLPPDGCARARTVLAASTHDSEEAVILDGLREARSMMPELRIIVAPRHPRRADAVVAAMAARGLAPARRSQGAGAAAPVLLADTLGEMQLWYAAAGIVVTGGSFAPLGGHTPWEPAAQRCAILHGPHITNFSEDYAQLDAAGAARAVSPDGLAAAIGSLVTNPDAARAMGARARAELLASAGDPAPLIATIRDLAAG